MVKISMTPRERWLAALRLQPVDRLPFWPKLGCSYAQSQQAAFAALGREGIYDWVGSDNHAWLPPATREVRPNSSAQTRNAPGAQITTFRTPGGTMEAEERFDEATQAWHPVRFPVRSREGILLMSEYYADCSVELNVKSLEDVRARAQATGKSASTWAIIGESPFMEWVETLAGIENAHYLLADYPAEVEELFDAMFSVLLRQAQIMIENHPADILYLNENTSTTLASPSQYRRYWLPHVRQIGLLCRQAGRPLLLHMCGHLKALLPDLAPLPAEGFEAFTSPTLGNTTLLDGRSACPDKCLIGGTNAMLWLRPAAEIIAQVEADLDVLPHHRGLVVSSAGLMPISCPPETIKAVADSVKRYLARM